MARVKNQVRIIKGEQVANGYTLQLLDKDDNNYYVFMGEPNSQINGVFPYPSNEDLVFVGWTITKNDIETLVDFPITLNDNKKLYPLFVQAKVCTITNLGSENPTDVVFTKSDNFPTENEVWEEVTVGNDKFAKFTPWYKKVVVDVNGNVREIHIANRKLGNDYHIYDCFLDEDGNELPYILIGRYCISSSQTANSVNASWQSMTLGDARSLARAKGTGYQLLDGSIYMFWRDMALAVGENVNFNPGTGVSSYLGLNHLNNAELLDGIGNYSGTYYYCNKPSKYTDNYDTSADYVALSYQVSTGTGLVKELGYDSSYPNMNFPSVAINSNDYSKYYCSGYNGTGYKVTRVSIGAAYADNGLFNFLANTNMNWSEPNRLCYRPIQGGAIQ